MWARTLFCPGPSFVVDVLSASWPIYSFIGHVALILGQYIRLCHENVQNRQPHISPPTLLIMFRHFCKHIEGHLK